MEEEKVMAAKTYMVRIPAYEIEVKAEDELEACEKALQEIHYDEMKVTIVTR